MKRYLVLAALAAATFIGGARSASADFLAFSIQINGLDLVDGATTGDVLDFLSINGMTVADPTADAVNLMPGSPPHTLTFYSGGVQVATFSFPTITTTTSPNSTPAGTVRSTIGGVSTSFSVDPSFYMGNTLTTAVLSITQPVTTPSAVYTGTFGGSIDVYAVPEPASMAMLAMGGLGVLGAARRRRKV